MKTEDLARSRHMSESDIPWEKFGQSRDPDEMRMDAAEVADEQILQSIIPILKQNSDATEETVWDLLERVVPSTVKLNQTFERILKELRSRGIQIKTAAHD